MSDFDLSDSRILWVFAATVLYFCVKYSCSRSFVEVVPEVKKPSRIDMLTVRLECLQEDLVIIKAQQLLHTNIMSDLAEAREMISSLRRELRQKTDLLVEGLCIVGHEQGDIVSWTKTLKSKMNLI